MSRALQDHMQMSRPSDRTRASIRKADRDLADQLAVVRAFAAGVPITAVPGAETSRTWQPPQPVREADVLHDSDTHAQWPMRQLFAEGDMVQRLAWARRLRPDARDGVLAALQRAADAGPA